jgi:hypothetical protein
MFKFLEERRQATKQLVQDSNQNDVDNLNDVRRGASRHFRNKTKEYLKAKIEELETSSKIKKLSTCIGSSMTLRRITNLQLSE